MKQDLPIWKCFLIWHTILESYHKIIIPYGVHEAPRHWDFYPLSFPFLTPCPFLGICPPCLLDFTLSLARLLHISPSSFRKSSFQGIWGLPQPQIWSHSVQPSILLSHLSSSLNYWHTLSSTVGPPYVGSHHAPTLLCSTLCKIYLSALP